MSLALVVRGPFPQHGFPHRFWYAVQHRFQHNRREGRMDADEKVRENRLRRMAERQGFALRKSRRRDPRAKDYGAYYLVEPHRADVIPANPDARLSLDQVEAILTGEDG